MKILFLLVIAALALSGCATTAKYETKLNTWIGASEDSLIAGWGVPSKTYSLDNGKKAVEFLHKETTQVGGYRYTEPQTSVQTGQVAGQPFTSTTTTYVTQYEPLREYEVYCRTSFILNKDGKVESWHHDGNGCVSR